MSETIVTTTGGRIRGVSRNGIATFLGVPYAAPPVGARRFALPQPVEPWSGVRDALLPGPNAPQAHRPFPGPIDVAPLVRPRWERGDDYLALNVWAPDPATRALPPLSRLPVLVWIHGGAFLVGDKDAPITDGTAFARSGVVCIAINYRMGIDGFLPIPGVPTNLGLRDQLAALAWVRENAAAFGGDPDNVTVFGESAGAMSIADLVTSPLAVGLFRRAIVESGHGAMVRPIAVAQRLVVKLAKMLGVSPDVDGFRRVSFEKGLAAVTKVQMPWARINLRDAEGREPAYGLSRFLPVYGDDVLPLPPIEALAAGAGRGIDLLIGTNREEMNLYLVATGLDRRIPRWLVPFILGRSEPRARAVLADYGRGRDGQTTGEVFATAASDLVFRLQARRYAAAHQGRTHFYEFGWRSNACAGRLGASHGMELPFVFDTLECCTGERGFAGTAPPQALADHVHSTWVRFATDGTLPWPEYDAVTRLVYRPEEQAATPEPPLPAAKHVP